MIKLSLLTLCLVLFSARASFADETYPIHLSRPHLPGETMTFSTKVDYKYSAKWTNPGNTNKPTEDAFKSTIEGSETINEVDKKGRPTKATVIVKQCAKDGKQILPAGTKIVIFTLHANMQYTVNGIPPTEDVRRVLFQTIGVAIPDDPTSDEMMGTTQTVRVGDTWKADCDQLAKTTHFSFAVTAADFQGEGKLTDVSKTDERLLESTELTTQCQFDLRTSRNGIVYNNMKMNLRWNHSGPVDGKPGPVTSDFKRTVTYTMVTPRGSEDITVDRSEQTRTDQSDN